MIKVTAQSLTAAASVEKSWFAVFADLIKARLTALVLLTTFVGFYAGWNGPLDLTLLFSTMLGTALVAAGAAALNQLLERDYDGLMSRTEDRPLPSGRMQPGTVLLFGVTCAVVGLIYLALAANPLTAILGAITLGTYLFVYTPLKRVTPLNTLVGAIPGALPPLMGWVAARGELTRGGWALFTILFFWQLPHFLAIAWIYREQYAKAGFVMLPVVDASGKRTRFHAVSHAFCLLPFSICPFTFAIAGPYYLAGALVLGAAYVWFAVRFSRRLSLTTARQLFFMSIIYLPLLLGLMVIDKVK